MDGAPTPARSVQDSEVFEDILDAIIDWNGISIADGYLRSGRRERRPPWAAGRGAERQTR